MGHTRAGFLMTLALAGIVGCGNTAAPPADVSGMYSINVTNRSNGCAFPNWMAGATATNIPLTITQDGTSVTGIVGGATRVWLDLVVGGHTLNGDVAGNSFDMILYGTRSYTAGMCAYTITMDARATLSGDSLDNGTLVYTLATNHAPDCGMKDTCESVQAFNGSRPPSGP